MHSFAHTFAIHICLRAFAWHQQYNNCRVAETSVSQDPAPAYTLKQLTIDRTLGANANVEATKSLQSIEKQLIFQYWSFSPFSFLSIKKCAEILSGHNPRYTTDIGHDLKMLSIHLKSVCITNRWCDFCKTSPSPLAFRSLRKMQCSSLMCAPLRTISCRLSASAWPTLSTQETQSLSSWSTQT